MMLMEHSLHAATVGEQCNVCGMDLSNETINIGNQILIY